MMLLNKRILLRKCNIINKRQLNIMVAVGGNAIKQPKEKGSLDEMFVNVKKASEQLANLIKNDHKLLITHGNGPQVGNIYLQNQICVEKNIPPMDLAACVAESEGLIGYMMQHEIENSLRLRNIKPKVVSLVTQMLTDVNDPAWKKPSKPIGLFYTKEEAMKLQAEGQNVMEDSGRGWRVCVPSPKPLKVLEDDAIKCLVENGFCVIAGGGGGIPVIENKDGTYTSKEAVIDKDFAAVKLAGNWADILLLLTDVPYCYKNYNTPQQEIINNITAKEISLDKSHFGGGSMLPKVEACAQFVESTGKIAIITSLDHALDALNGNAGTRITN